MGKKELSGKSKKEEAEPEAKAVKEEEPVNDLMKEVLEDRKKRIKTKKENSLFKKGGTREDQTLALLSGFVSKIDSIADVDEENEEGVVDEEDELNDGSWMSHRLNFEPSAESAKDANMKTDDWYDIYDPRNPINQRRRENSKKEMKEKKR